MKRKAYFFISLLIIICLFSFVFYIFNKNSFFKKLNENIIIEPTKNPVNIDEKQASILADKLKNKILTSLKKFKKHKKHKKKKIVKNYKWTLKNTVGFYFSGKSEKFLKEKLTQVFTLWKNNQKDKATQLYFQIVLTNPLFLKYDNIGLIDYLIKKYKTLTIMKDKNPVYKLKLAILSYYNSDYETALFNFYEAQKIFSKENSSPKLINFISSFISRILKEVNLMNK